MFEQAFKNIDDALWKESGCTTELDYTEQTSWLLFLKYLDGLEQDKAAEAMLEGKPYRHILDAQYRWESWAAPKDDNGKLDHNRALTGDDLVDFVDRKLFPYLHGFKQRASGPDTIEYKIGEIFGEIKNKVRSGYTLRPLIRAMIQVTQPKIGERIYDGACGSAGFLCEAHDYLSKQPKLSTSDLETLQTRTFYGKEKKSLAYVIAIMNLILHGIEAPNIVHTNTLAENLSDIQDKDLAEFIELQQTFADSGQSWTVDRENIDKTSYDLSVKNPNGGEAVTHRSPQDIMDEIAALDAESAAVLGNIRALLASGGESNG